MVNNDISFNQFGMWIRERSKIPPYAIKRFSKVIRTMRAELPRKLPALIWLNMLEVQSKLYLISPAWEDVERNQYNKASWDEVFSVRRKK